MIRLPVLILTLLIATPTLSQSYLANWHYQIELNQQLNGEIKISYALIPTGLQVLNHTPNAQNQPELIDVDQTMNPETMDLLRVTNNNKDGRNYQMTLNYFKDLNENIPAVIKMPENSFNKRFPQSKYNQFYPLPDGN